VTTLGTLPAVAQFAARNDRVAIARARFFAIRRTSAFMIIAMWIFPEAGGKKQAPKD
jgi:hypothetical protein